MSVTISLGKLLKNLVHLRRLKNTKVLNPAVLMGLTSTSPDDLNSLWGADPVHRTSTAYDTMATKLIDEIDSETVLHSRLLSGGQSDPGLSSANGPFSGNQRATREPWTSGFQTIAERLDNTSHGSFRGSNRNKGGRGGHRGHGRGGHP